MIKRPVITLEPGRLPWNVDETERYIVDNYACWGLYQRGGMLVRETTLSTETDEREIHRPAGARILRMATPVMLQDVFGRAIQFENAKGSPIDCPTKVAATYLSRAGLWRLPTLVGITDAPVLRADGTVLSEPGYDRQTGLLLQSATAWRPLPSLSREAVDAAVRCLLEPFAEFPLSDAGRSVVISAILTGLQRRLLFSAPAHAFDKPTQGSGGSLLADCVAIIVTGRWATTMSANADEEELRKKLVSVLIAGDPVVSLDNITRPLRSDALASILTLAEYKDRPLGVSQIVAVPTSVLFLLTGNNLVFAGDMPSRVVVARIEPDVERPEERTFKIGDLRAHLTEHRAKLITAALTILQAYFIAGRPAQNVKPFGRFEQWSKEIREAIVWAGLPDPCATREAVIAADPDRDAALAIFEAWHRLFGDNKLTIARLIQSTGADGELKDALLNVAADTDHSHEVNARRLAAWCRNRVGRVVGDFKLSRCAGAHGGFMMWQVVHRSDEKIVREV